MSIPDFERAEYVKPDVIDGNTGFVVGSGRASMAALPLALVYGVAAAIVGAIGYGAISMTGFMVSIVSIGIGWLIARAMMTATRGVRGRTYQILAVILTYLSCSTGSVGGGLLRAHIGFATLGQHPEWYGTIVASIIAGPFLRFTANPFWAAMGLLPVLWVEDGVADGGGGTGVRAAGRTADDGDGTTAIASNTRCVSSDKSHA